MQIELPGKLRDLQLKGRIKFSGHVNLHIYREISQDWMLESYNNSLQVTVHIWRNFAMCFGSYHAN